MYGVVITKYDNHIVGAMDLIKNFIKDYYKFKDIKIIWILNIIDAMPYVEELRALEAEYKWTIETHELTIAEGAMEGHNISDIVKDIKKRNEGKLLKFIIGNHYTDSREAIVDMLKFLELSHE